MQNLDWYNRLSENLEDAIDEYGSELLVSLFQSEDLWIDFPLYERDLCVKVESASGNSFPHLIKYSPYEGNFYHEENLYTCECGQCEESKIIRRIIFESTESLINHIEVLIRMDMKQQDMSAFSPEEEEYFKQNFRPDTEA